VFENPEPLILVLHVSHCPIEIIVVYYELYKLHKVIVIALGTLDSFAVQFALLCQCKKLPFGELGVM